MKPKRGLHTFLAMSAAIVWGGWLLHADIPTRVRALVQERLSFGAAELTMLDRGRPVAKTLRAGDRRDMAAVGSVRVDVPAHFFLERFVDIVSFKQSPMVRQIGKFSDPPRREDLATLAFEQEDLDELRRCRVGDCGIQLSADQIRRIQATVDWSKRDARAQANDVLREFLFENIESYRNSGNRALLEYANERVPLKINDELQLLVSHSHQMLAGVPEFSDALLSTTASLRGATEFIYWSKEQFGLKPVVSITHVIMYLPQRPDVPDVLIASKQIYASRYLGGSLAITLGVDASLDGVPSFYMVYANRTRPRALPKVIGGLVRRVAQGKARDGLEVQLQLTKDRLESVFAASSK